MLAVGMLVVLLSGYNGLAEGASSRNHVLTLMHCLPEGQYGSSPRTGAQVRTVGSQDSRAHLCAPGHCQSCLSPPSSSSRQLALAAGFEPEMVFEPTYKGTDQYR